MLTIIKVLTLIAVSNSSRQSNWLIVKVEKEIKPKVYQFDNLDLMLSDIWYFQFDNET